MWVKPFYGSNGAWRSLPEVEAASLQDDDSIAYEMGQLAINAVHEAQQNWQRRLDFSPGSVEVLEDILAAVHKVIRKRNSFFGRLLGQSLSEDEIWNLGYIWGSYLGEVMRINNGFEWHFGNYVGGEIIHLRRGPSTACVPHSKVFKRLADGSGDEIPAYYRFIVDTLRSST
jgi:hypothetical protein